MKKKLLFVDANRFGGWATSESLPYDEKIFVKKVNLKVSFSTLDD